MAFFSIYQYFVDYELFVKPHSLYGDYENFLEQSNITRRSTSFIGSPQNLGFYLVIVFPLTNLFIKRVFSRFISKSIVLLGGLLSGSSTFGVGLIIFYIINAFQKRKLRKRTAIIKIFLSIILLILIGSAFKEDVAYLNALKPGLSSHFAYYKIYFQDTSIINIFFGHGLGYADRLTEKYFVNRPDSGWLKSSESYVLRIYYEVGAIGVILYALIIFSSIRILRKNNSPLLPKPILGITVLIIINALFTPVQSGITGSFLSWAFIIFPYAAKRTGLSKQEKSNTVIVPSDYMPLT